MSDMRISGLASGLDTEDIISQLMSAEREVRVTKLEQQKQIKLWQQEMYQEINSDVANFILDIKSEFGLINTSSTGTIYSKTADSFTWVKSATSSDETVAAATATSSAMNGSYKLNIDSLAENVSKTSIAAISSTDYTSTDALYEQFQDNGILAGETLTFRIETKTTASDTTNYPDGYKEFSFDTETDTLEDVIDEINNANIGISASYDSDLDRVFFNTTSTGEENYFKITNDSHNFLSGTDETGNTNVLNLKIQEDSTYKGTNLQFDLGDANDMTKSSNTFTVNGITITAKSTGSTTIGVDTNVDSVYEKIEGFVESYNELISTINTKLDEDRDRDYDPLTDEQKDAMEEEEIELWEAKAKSGLLSNDSILSRLVGNVRTGMYDTVYTSYTSESENTLLGSVSQLTQIGITTGEYSSKGKLEIDETKLKQAILENPDGVMDLFFKDPSDEVNQDDSNLTEAEKEQKYNESGLITRLFNTMTNGIKEIVNKAGPGDDSDLLRDVKSTILVDFITNQGYLSILDDNILDLEDRIDTQEDLLERIEDRYWSQYTALETALNEMNSQSSWLASQLGTTE